MDNIKEVVINIKTENDAFSMSQENEISRIIECITRQGIYERPLYDLNGNRVGEIKIIY